jgi:hypothetical protein
MQLYYFWIKGLLKNPNQLFFSALKTGFSALRFLRRTGFFRIGDLPIAENPVLSAEKNN